VEAKKAEIEQLMKEIELKQERVERSKRGKIAAHGAHQQVTHFFPVLEKTQQELEKNYQKTDNLEKRTKKVLSPKRKKKKKKPV
jgi:hypothetical protein